MTQYHIQKTFERYGPLSDKCISVMRMFGLTKERLYRIRFVCDALFSVEPGNIVYITGASGSGKTVVLTELEKVIPRQQRINLSAIDIPSDKAVVDCINDDLIETLKYFSTAGLADCPALLSTPANLSEGQQSRFRLALALAAKRPFVFADEFCSLLDRITAACISHGIRKFADKYNVTFILASSHQDILIDLLPDVIVTRDLSGNTEVTYKKLKLKNKNQKRKFKM